MPKIHISKSITINAPVEKVRPMIEDFVQWKHWSPWSVCEPDHEVTYKGDTGQVGHSMEWNGKVIGSGRITIEKVTGTEIAHHLEFFKPMKSQSKSGFNFESEGETTTVTWYMDSSIPFFLFFMARAWENWIGCDYDRGLRMLKTLAEDGNIPVKTTNKGIVPIEGFSYVGIQKTSKMEDIPTDMMAGFDQLIQDVVVSKGKSAKHWITLYPKVNMSTLEFTYICACSDEEIGDEDLPEGYVRGEIKSGNALEIKHDGSYEYLGNAWSMGMMNMRAQKCKKAGKPFEYYWNSPKEVAPEELQTSIYFPVK